MQRMCTGLCQGHHPLARKQYPVHSIAPLQDALQISEFSGNLHAWNAAPVGTGLAFSVMLHAGLTDCC